MSIYIPILQNNNYDDQDNNVIENSYIASADISVCFSNKISDYVPYCITSLTFSVLNLVCIGFLIWHLYYRFQYLGKRFWCKSSFLFYFTLACSICFQVFLIDSSLIVFYFLNLYFWSLFILSMIYVFCKKVIQMYSVRGVSGKCIKAVYFIIFTVYTVLLAINISYASNSQQEKKYILPCYSPIIKSFRFYEFVFVLTLIIFQHHFDRSLQQKKDEQKYFMDYEEQQQKLQNKQTNIKQLVLSNVFAQFVQICVNIVYMSKNSTESSSCNLIDEEGQMSSYFNSLFALFYVSLIYFVPLLTFIIVFLPNKQKYISRKDQNQFQIQPYEDQSFQFYTGLFIKNKNGNQKQSITSTSSYNNDVKNLSFSINFGQSKDRSESSVSQTTYNQRNKKSLNFSPDKNKNSLFLNQLVNKKASITSQNMSNFFQSGVNSSSNNNNSSNSNNYNDQKIKNVKKNQSMSINPTLKRKKYSNQNVENCQKNLRSMSFEMTNTNFPLSNGKPRTSSQELKKQLDTQGWVSQEIFKIEMDKNKNNLQGQQKQQLQKNNENQNKKVIYNNNQDNIQDEKSEINDSQSQLQQQDATLQEIDKIQINGNECQDNPNQIVQKEIQNNVINQNSIIDDQKKQ